MDNETFNIVAENVRSERSKKAFEMTSREAFSKLNDKELAATQAEFKPNDPQYILASHEWNVRLLASELRALRFTAWMGIVGTVIGVLLGYLLK